MNYRLPTCAAALVPACALASNYLLNPGFEDWHQNVDGSYGGTYTGQSFNAAGSGADDWFIANFTYGTTTTARLSPPAGLQGAGNWSMYLTTSVAGNGVGQSIEVEVNQNFYPVPLASVSGWVYVTSGSAGIEYEDSNETFHVAASTSTLNQWVYLSANLTNVEGVNFLVVGLTPDASFYADNMDADSQPSPEPASLLALGLGALALRRRKRG